jgi:hypothetical protein
LIESIQVKGEKMSTLYVVLLCGAVSAVSFVLGAYGHSRAVRRKMGHFALKSLHELSRVNPDEIARRYVANTINGVTKIVIDDQPLETFQLDQE